MQTRNAARERGLAGAGLAHDRDAGILRHGEMDSEQDLAVAVERVEPGHLQHGSGRGLRGFGKVLPRRGRKRPPGVCLTSFHKHAAGQLPSPIGWDQFWHRDGAPFDDERAPGRETAARWPLPGARRDSLHADQAPGTLRRRNRAQQPLGIGVCGCGEHIGGCSRLDDPARVNDRNPVGQLADNNNVMADIDGGNPVRGTHASDGIEHRALRRDVEPRGRLIEHDEARPACEGHRDRDSLQLAAGQLMRVNRENPLPGIKADLGKHLFQPRVRLLALPTVRGEDLLEHAADAQRWVDGRGRVLRDVRDRRPPQLAQLCGRQREQVGPIEAHRSGDDLQPAARMTDHGQAESCLARAGLSDHAKHFAGGNFDGHVLDDGCSRPGRGDGQTLHD